MKTFEEFNALDEGIVSNIGTFLGTQLGKWLANDADFKARVEKELGMPFDQAMAQVKEKIAKNPGALDMVGKMVADDLLKGKFFKK